MDKIDVLKGKMETKKNDIVNTIQTRIQEQNDLKGIIEQSNSKLEFTEKQILGLQNQLGLINEILGEVVVLESVGKDPVRTDVVQTDEIGE